jgi:hypothetical protein
MNEILEYAEYCMDMYLTQKEADFTVMYIMGEISEDVYNKVIEDVWSYRELA